MTRLHWAFGVVLLTFVAGCGSKHVTVSGTVTWEGDGKPKEPVKKGMILFVPEDGKSVGFNGEIRDGKYSVQMPPGKMKVEIRADREVPGAKVDPAMGAIPRHQYLPAWYNDRTKLRAEVTAAGPNDFPFDLRDKE